MTFEQYETCRSTGRVSVADIAAQPGGIEALQRRVHELRSRGVDFAANAIEHEMAELDLPRE
ncbi:hypothetical protein [Nocardia jinanensis]|uniref:Uncharacterized protein n=1 Tax=Nocardia jinanensis TaxID=382504 RepID=A0A917RGX7_9NOCA|nr:hypothetical protein [Nocardia jinanensis]GGL06128.1 hypothetical protein GCM10011588_20780 [Nocardia jinanensis]